MNPFKPRAYTSGCQASNVAVMRTHLLHYVQKFEIYGVLLSIQYQAPVNEDNLKCCRLLISGLAASCYMSW